MKIVGYEKSSETHFYKLVKEQGMTKKVRISKEDYLKKMVKKGGLTPNGVIKIRFESIQDSLKWNPSIKGEKLSDFVNSLIKYILETPEPIHKLLYLVLKQNYIKGKVLNNDHLLNNARLSFLIEELSKRYKIDGRNTQELREKGITKDDIISYIETDGSLTNSNKKISFKSYIDSIYDVINKKNE